MRRFFYDTTVQIEGIEISALASHHLGELVALPDDVRHHWCRVLRADIGDKSWLFDGHGSEYLVELTEVSKKHATAKLLQVCAEDRTSAMVTCIGLVMSRGERMDYAVQKATELGVTAIQLLTSQHGEVHLKGAQIEKKLNHWQQVAIAACEQCGLNRPPLIMAPISLTEWLAAMQAEQSDDDQPQRLALSASISIDCNTVVSDTVASDPVVSNTINPSMVARCMQPLLNDDYYQALQLPVDSRLLLSVPAAGQPTIPVTLAPALSQPHPHIVMLIGPEGGLNAEECSQAISAGFAAWQIGSRILRTETAPVVALASLHALHRP